MTIKTLALAGAAAFALMSANGALAQNGATDTAPAATDTNTAPGTDAAAPAATDTAAAPAKKKHHKHKMKAAMSTSQEEQTTAQLNEQQAQHPGSTPAAAPADTGNAANPAAQSDKMGNDGMTMNHGDMKSDNMKTDHMKDMKDDMNQKKDQATTPPPTTNNPTP